MDTQTTSMAEPEAEQKEEEDWTHVVNVEVDEDVDVEDIRESKSGHYDATRGNDSVRQEGSEASSTSTRKPVVLKKIQEKAKANADPQKGGWDLLSDMSTGLGEYLNPNGKAPPLSDAGVKFRENPRKWLRGLNLRSTRLAFGVHMESHTVQLIMVILIIIDVCAIFGDMLLASVCDSSSDKVHDTKLILHSISMTALSIFLFQQLVLIAAYGVEFFRKPLYVIDFTIVAGALILELTLRDASGRLIVLLMLWRGARVIHGFAVTIETEEDQIHRAQDNVEKLRLLLTHLLGYEITMFRVHNMKQAARIIQHAFLRYFISKKEKENKVILDSVAKSTPDEKHSHKSYEYAKELLDHLSDKDAAIVQKNHRLIEEAKRKVGRMKYSLPLFNIHVALQEKDVYVPGIYGVEDEEEPPERRSSMESIFSRSSALRSTSMLDLVMETIQEDANASEGGSFRFGSSASFRFGSNVRNSNRGSSKYRQPDLTT